MLDFLGDSLQVTSYSDGNMLTVENCDRVIESGLDGLVFGTDGATKERYESIRMNLLAAVISAGVDKRPQPIFRRRCLFLSPA